MALSPDSPIRTWLGPELHLLEQWCWMPDWMRSVRSTTSGAFWVDDYLLVPGFPTHVSHVVPHVEAAWEPAFRRALLALQSEDPVQAARWVGTLVHYVQDSGAPPHAWPHGPHGPMENWVTAERIGIPGYFPRCFGESVEAAVRGFLAAMRDYVNAAAQRGQAIEPLAVASNRPAVEERALVSANESAKMTADVLHTLGMLVRQTADGAVVLGRVRWDGPWPTNVPLPKVAVLTGQLSSVCDSSGRWQWRGIPPGPCELLVMAPGRSLVRETVVIRAPTTMVEITLPAPISTDNWLMNPDFSIRWTGGPGPDYWKRQKNSWESEPVPVRAGGVVRVKVDWAPKAQASLVVRWRNTSAPTGGRTQSEAPIEPPTNEAVFAVPGWAQWARVDLHMGGADPTNAIRVLRWSGAP